MKSSSIILKKINFAQIGNIWIDAPLSGNFLSLVLGSPCRCWNKTMKLIWRNGCNFYCVCAEGKFYFKEIVPSVISFFVISIVIDSDRGHWYGHLKKVSPWHVFECLCVRWIFKKLEKWSFELFRLNLHEVGLFHSYFLCKCSFREISMIKMVILDQSKPILLIFENRKIKKSEICKLHVYYS